MGRPRVYLKLMILVKHVLSETVTSTKKNCFIRQKFDAPVTRELIPFECKILIFEFPKGFALFHVHSVSCEILGKLFFILFVD